MKRNVFTKYIWVFFIIIVVSFIILSVIVSSISVRSIYSDRQSSSRNININLSKYIEREMIKNGTNSLEQFISTNMDDINSVVNMASYGTNDQIIVLITDLNGEILVSTNGYYHGKMTIEYDSINDKKENSYSGSLPNDDSEYTINMNPISKGTKQIGYILTCYNSNQLTTLSYQIVKAIVLTSMWVMIVSFIIIYVISEKITSPLKQMSLATKKIAEGNFNLRINVDSNDEIADLAIAFNTMAKSLSELEKMRSSFLANVSHDLRTPMTTISGFIDGILSGAIPEDKEKYYLGIIQQEVKRLSRIVSDLLEISRLEAGSRKFDITNFDIAEMTRIILLTFENKINEKNLDVEFNIDKDNIYIDSDRDCIYRIIYNICDNAVKFSYENGKYIINIKDYDDKVSISIFNEGIGISDEDITHIFERFYKSDKSRGLDKTGTGLGLYITKTMLDNLNGTISVKSEYKKNCEFTVILNKDIKKVE